MIWEKSRPWSRENQVQEKMMTEDDIIDSMNTWVKVTQLGPNLCKPVGYTVHGIFQARILKWLAFPFSWGSSQPRDWTQVSHIAGGFFTRWATSEAQESWVAYPFSSGSSRPRNRYGVSCIGGGFFTNWATRRHEFEHILGDSEGQGSLACCSPRGREELDTT